MRSVTDQREVITKTNGMLFIMCLKWGSFITSPIYTPTIALYKMKGRRLSRDNTLTQYNGLRAAETQSIMHDLLSKRTTHDGQVKVRRSNKFSSQVLLWRIKQEKKFTDYEITKRR